VKQAAARWPAFVQVHPAMGVVPSAGCNALRITLAKLIWHSWEMVGHIPCRATPGASSSVPNLTMPRARDERNNFTKGKGQPAPRTPTVHTPSLSPFQKRIF